MLSIIATVLALARSVLKGPPGITFIRKNVMVAITNSVSKDESIRRITNFAKKITYYS